MTGARYRKGAVMGVAENSEKTAKKTPRGKR